MKTQEIKNEINQVLDTMSDDLLAEVLAILAKAKSEETLRANLKRILAEDDALLQELAK